MCMQSGRAMCPGGCRSAVSVHLLYHDNTLLAMKAEPQQPWVQELRLQSRLNSREAYVDEGTLSSRVAAPHTKWEHGRLSVRFPLRRGADLSAVLAEVAAQLGGGGGRKGPASPGAAEGAGKGAGCPALEGEVVTKARARTPLPPLPLVEGCIHTHRPGL